MKILVTGAAGFIGFFTSTRLAERGDEVVGLDAINDYYDPALKFGRLAEAGFDVSACAEYGRTAVSAKRSSLRFVRLGLEDKEGIDRLFAAEKFDAVCHLAAQAGVRYSITNPSVYVTSNLVGFSNVIEAVRSAGIGNFCYASSSSVYGLNKKQPFSTHDNVDHPVSLYAATKKANELLAHSYSHLFQIPTTGLRFFTVYGPWGRPDMAYFLFTKAILDGKPIQINNFGDMKRDFTYVDDIVEGVMRVIDHPAAPDPSWNPDDPDPATAPGPYRIYNIGFGNPVGLMDLVEAIEKELGMKAEKILKPMPAGDVPSTFADTKDLERDLGYRPKIDIGTGIRNFVAWYKRYYRR